MTRWSTEVEAVVGALEERVVPERREKAKSYFPSAMEVMGVPVPGIRKEVRRLVRSHRNLDEASYLALVRALLDTGRHEVRQVAFEVLGARKDIVRGLDGTSVEALGQGNDNWASVDCFCVFVSGQAWRDGRVIDGDVHRWAGSPDRWWRRTALVSTVPLNMKSRGGSGDTDRTLAVCGMLVVDRDPMVVKGLSWALRSLVPSDPSAVGTFLEAYGEELAPLVRREVGNKLSTGKKNPRP